MASTPGALSRNRLAQAARRGQAIFDDFRNHELQPASLADANANRALIDRRIICDPPGFDAGAYQAVRRPAAKRRAVPSVHGGKPRPQGAGLAV